MPDMNKVLNGLERCSFPCRESCRECPYYPVGTSGCAQLAKDALELLKEQEKDIIDLSERCADLLDRMLEESGEC